MCTICLHHCYSPCVCADLQVADDAVVLRPVQAAGGGGAEVDGSSNQKVSCGRVTAALRAAVRGRWELLSNHTESWKKGELTVSISG